MPQVDVQKSRNSRKPLLLVAVLLSVVVVILAGVAFWRWQSLAGDRYNAVRVKADKELQRLQYDQAITTYKDYLKTNPSHMRAYQTKVYLAQVYQQKQDFAQALDWYQQAEKMDSSWDPIVKPGIGDVARELHQNDVAIKYYREAIELAEKSNSPLRGQTVEEYKASIRSMGGKVD
jgi:tetratricopeptide (TPR) repeat protein